MLFIIFDTFSFHKRLAVLSSTKINKNGVRGHEGYGVLSVIQLSQYNVNYKLLHRFEININRPWFRGMFRSTVRNMFEKFKIPKLAIV